MNFAILFNTENKTCRNLKEEEVNLNELNQSRFAWLDFDLAEKEKLEEILPKLNISADEMKMILNPAHKIYYRHSQNLLFEILEGTRRQGEALTGSLLIVLMTDKIIITVHEGDSLYIKNVYEKYEESFKTVGKSPGFIYFLLWDAIIDEFLPQISHIDEKLEQVEERYLHGSGSRNIVDEIIQAKRMVRKLKQSLSPMQRSMRNLVAIKLALISDEARHYLQGLFDHMDRLAYSIDSLQDRVHATLAGYTSILSQQINNSMKVLAIIATIMMPLSLLAGIYGTNFAYIPELNWRYGYFTFLGVLVLLGVLMLIIFKRRKWI